MKRLRDGDQDLLPQIVRDPRRGLKVYGRPLFSAELIADLGVVPSEYLYFYYSTDEAVARLRSAGRTRAEQILEINQRLAEALSRGEGLAAYEVYLDERNATYFQLETGSRRARQDVYSASAGYDRIALAVLTALHQNTGDVIAIDVDNEGAIPGYDGKTTVEVPCAINRDGPRPLPVGAVPPSVAPLLRRVKEYEEMTVRAALQGSIEGVREALAANPLVDSRSLAEDLLAHFVRLHPKLLACLP